VNHPERKRILLTGAAGHVGLLLTPLLRRTFALRLCDIRPVAAEGDDEAAQGDLADPGFARQAVEGATGVVHLAALVASQVSFEDTLNPNYRAMLAVLEACRLEGVRRLVYSSSHHIAGLYPSDRMYGETDAPAPDGFYGLSKAFGEAACALYAMRFGIATLVIRIGNAFPQVVDGRRERLWISAPDLAQLVTIGLTAEDLRYEVVYGISNCPDPIFRNEAAARLGYQARDSARDHHAPRFRGLPQLAAEDGPALVGGSFAADPLPDPFNRAAERSRERRLPDE
jgi:uronate dehydrogenase